MSEIKKVLWKLLSTIQGVRLLGRVSKNQSLCGSFGKFYKLISVHLSLSVSKPKWGEGNGNLLQYSCLENPVDSGAWRAAIHRVAQSRTQLKQLSMHECTGEGKGNPLQYSCLENPRDRAAWWAAICGVAQSRTWLKWCSNSNSKSRKIIKLQGMVVLLLKVSCTNPLAEI